MPTGNEGLMRCGTVGMAMQGRGASSYPSRAAGALYGALVASAAVASLRVPQERPSLRDIAEAMGLGGGGEFDYGPGQVETLGEFVFVLARSLNDGGSPEVAAEDLAAWAESGALGTCPHGMWESLSVRQHADEREGEGPNPLAMLMYARAASFGDIDEPGALVVAVPLGIATAGGMDPSDDLFVDRFTALVSGNAETISAVRDCAHFVADAITHGRDHALVRQWGEEIGGETPTSRAVFDHARSLAVRAEYFEEAVRMALQWHGPLAPTAIVTGALYGALRGTSSIPLKLRNQIERVEPEIWPHPRPERYVPRDVERLAHALVVKDFSRDGVRG
jgi:hypothetical protein